MTTQTATIATKLIDLVASFGPGMAPWVLLFVFVAFFALFVVRMAYTNTQKIMREGEALRLTYVRTLADADKQLERKDRVIEARDMLIAHLRDDQQTTIDFVTNQRKIVHDLEDKLIAQTRINTALTNDLSDALTEIEELRNELRELKDGTA